MSNPNDGNYFVQSLGGSFGPYDHWQVLQMIARGKVTSETLVARNGYVARASEFIEFVDALANASSGVEPTGTYDPWRGRQNAEPTGFQGEPVGGGTIVPPQGSTAPFGNDPLAVNYGAAPYQAPPPPMTAALANSDFISVPLPPSEMNKPAQVVQRAEFYEETKKSPLGVNARLNLFFILSVAFYLLFLGSYFVPMHTDANASVAAILFFLLGATAEIMTSLFVWAYWRSIPSCFARTTPGLAAWLLLIPLFNLYWFFVAFVGGAIDLNRALDLFSDDPAARKNRVSLERPVVAFVCFVLAVCLSVFVRAGGVAHSSIESLESSLGTVVGIVALLGFIVFILALFSMRRGAVTLNNLREDRGLYQARGGHRVGKINLLETIVSDARNTARSMSDRIAEK